MTNTISFIPADPFYVRRLLWAAKREMRVCDLPDPAPCALDQCEAAGAVVVFQSGRFRRVALTHAGAEFLANMD